MSCFGPSWFARIALVIFRVPFAVPGVFTLYTRTMFHIWQDAEIRFEPELLRLQQWATHIPKMLSIVSLTAVQLIVRFEVPEIMNKLTKNQIFISFLIKLVHVHLLIYVHVYHLRVYCMRTCTICWWCLTKCIHYVVSKKLTPRKYRWLQEKSFKICTIILVHLLTKDESRRNKIWRNAC